MAPLLPGREYDTVESLMIQTIIGLDLIQVLSFPIIAETTVSKT
jgi:hypothetical protein